MRVFVRLVSRPVRNQNELQYHTAPVASVLTDLIFVHCHTPGHLSHPVVIAGPRLRYLSAVYQ